MTQPAIRIALDLHPVGPRAPNRATASVWLGVNISSGYETEPDTGPLKDFIDALMPQALLPDPLEFRLFVLARTPDERSRLPADKPAPNSFADKVAQNVETIAKELAEAGNLEVVWDGGHVEGGDEEVDANGTLKRWPWLGLSTSLGRLPPDLAQATRARCYVEVDATWLRNAQAADAAAQIILAPESVYDSNRGAQYKLDRYDVGAPHCTVIYRAKDVQGNDLPDLHAYTMPLRLDALFTTNSATPLADYWLAVSDSRHDSMADIDAMIARNADPSALVMLPSAELLGASLAIAGSKARLILPAHVAAVRSAAKAWADALQDDIRKSAIDALVADVLTQHDLTPAVLAQHVQNAIAKAWLDYVNVAQKAIVEGRVPLAEEAKLRGDDKLTLDTTVLADGLAPLVGQFLRIDAESTSVLPGEGLDFLVGERGKRLVAAGTVPTQERTDFNEMAEFGLLVRRASRQADLGSAPWRIVTAGAPLLDPNKVLSAFPWGSPETLALEVHDRIVVRGIALAFKDGVLRNDDAYFGQMITGPRALSFVHDTRGEAEEPSGAPPGAAELHYVSATMLALPNADFARAPVLRYGDWYDLLAPLIDRVGGLPIDLTDGKPWSADLAKLALLGAQNPSIQFLRRVPLGDLNLKPLVDAAWPKPPADVQLRVVEWHDAATESQATPPTLLFSDFAYSAGLGALTTYAFTVEPPCLDEHSLQRWALPPTDAPAAEARAAVQAFKDEYVRIMDIRNELQERDLPPGAEKDMLPHDPAVSAILLKRRLFGTDGSEVAINELVVALSAAGTFRKVPITVTVGLNLGPDPMSVIGSDVSVQAPPEGHFSELKIDLLCLDVDHARFDGDALGYGDLATYAAGGKTYVVHPGETILLETVSDTLPDAFDLYEAISLTVDDAGRVPVAVDGTRLSNLAFVDRYTIDRQRWIWRNLPYVVDPQTGDTLERRLTSGLPFALSSANPQQRDTDLATMQFDAIAELDHGFVSRTQAKGRWPREKGAPAVQPVLVVDDRDAQTAAEYLRYGLTIVSRYAALLEPAKRSVTASPRAKDPQFKRTQGNWRRIAARYRGREELRVPNILAVLPMTASPIAKPGGLEATEGTTPFLVIVDEISFREFGHGEGLRAELALEDREIGDDPERLVRYGPLPTKHLLANPDNETYSDVEAEPGDAKYEELKLSVFGPFGYSLDRSGNEALANASAFVIYLPADKKIGPEWSVAVRFRRVLHDLQSGSPVTQQVGPASSNYLLYTLSDSRLLIMPDAAVDPVLHVSLTGGTGVPTGVVRFEHAAAQLVPYIRDGHPPDRLVMAQYRYVLLVGHRVRDGGRAIDAFLPEQAFWMDSPDKIRQLDTAAPKPLVQGENLYGQVVEIELSDPGSSLAGELEKSAKTLHHLFKSLLCSPEPSDGAGQPDALGRILRVSTPFEVRAD